MNLVPYRFLIVAIGFVTLSALPVDERPNIVVILADDLGIGDPGCYNPDSKVPTPHIDRLASEGLRLTDAHSPSAVCSPTRYGLLTGRYAWRTRLTRGVLWGDSPNLIDLERTTIAELLKSAGYRTACFGKWHLGLGRGPATDWTAPLQPGPLDHGFDEFFGIPASLDMVPYLFVEDDHPVAAPTTTIKGSAHRRDGGGGFWRTGPASPDFRHIDVLPTITDRAVGFLERASADRERPFFLYLPLSAPHTPWVPTEAFRGTSGAGHYGDFAAQVDGAIGRVLTALDELRLADNTLVLVTSDNGAHWPERDIAQYGHDANLRYRGQKADIWEGGHRVPFVVRWPNRVPAGAVRDELVSLTDLFATLAAVTGMEIPVGAANDSINQLPVLLGETLERAPRHSMIHHSLDGHFAVRRGAWKLIPFRGSGGFTEPSSFPPRAGDPPGQLYHLKDDPRETENLYAVHSAMVRTLAEVLSRERFGTVIETVIEAESPIRRDPEGSKFAQPFYDRWASGRHSVLRFHGQDRRCTYALNVPEDGHWSVWLRYAATSSARLTAGFEGAPVEHVLGATGSLSGKSAFGWVQLFAGQRSAGRQNFTLEGAPIRPDCLVLTNRIGPPRMRVSAPIAEYDDEELQRLARPASGHGPFAR